MKLSNDRISARTVYLALLALVVMTMAVVISPSEIVQILFQYSGNPLFIFALLLIFLVRPLLAIPVSPILIFVGFLYGLEGGIVVAQFGTVLTAIPAYAFARFGPDLDGRFEAIKRKGNSTVESVGAYRSVLAAMLSPAPLDAVAYGAGITGIPLRIYLSATFIGVLPWSIAYGTIGASMDTLTTSLSAELRILVLVTGVLAVALIAPHLYKLTGSQIESLRNRRG